MLCVSALLKHLAQNVVEDAAVLVVGDLEGRIDAGYSGEILFFALRVARENFYFLLRLELFAQSLEIEKFETGESQRFEIFTGHEFQRKHAHADKIAAMDALETFGQHRANTEKQRSFSRPVARGA